MHRLNDWVLSAEQQMLMAASFAGAAVTSLLIWWFSMQSGIRALNGMDRTPT